MALPTASLHRNPNTSDYRLFMRMMKTKDTYRSQILGKKY